MDKRGIENLRYGIVEQAIEDYIQIKARIKKESAECSLNELKRFFGSGYYEFLCDIDGDKMIRMLDKKAMSMRITYRVYCYNSHHYEVYPANKNMQWVPQKWRGSNGAHIKARKLSNVEQRFYHKLVIRDFGTYNKYVE